MRVGKPEHRQTKGRLRNEGIAADRLEGQAGGIGRPLVVARDDDAKAALLDGDLRRTKDMAGRMERNIDVAEADRLAERGRLAANAKSGP